ncbi:MAG: hypothetical protein IT216_12235 [Saprospiraceae bacterium]|nr:MAG: calcium-binding protein [Candidatus Parvibacillus calidus]MBK7739841.1 hypothetical protein [Candidatus Parvibacillus calidus]MCC7149979.1 hypothetical protein [Saprospiraceae bacterium]WKZ62745.1 MAG: hypothetical protein QY315_13350 [Saprospiraceae bacterium]
MKHAFKAFLLLMIFFIVGSVNAQNRSGDDGQASMRAAKIKSAQKKDQSTQQKSNPAHASLFDNLDTNKDGKVSREEANKSNLVIIKEKFDNLDTNKDGFLSKAEVQNARYNVNKGQQRTTSKVKSSTTNTAAKKQ